ncbi:hypothetical protein Tco_1268615 [Tanacetum coccineum]
MATCHHLSGATWHVGPSTSASQRPVNAAESSRVMGQVRSPPVSCHVSRWDPLADRRGADMDTTAKDKVKGPSTSNSFDALNTLDIEDEYGTSSSRSNQVEDQETRHKVSQLKNMSKPMMNVDEFILS